MLCKKPFMGSGGVAYGCGQCGPCRYNKRRIWMHRIMLEANQYENNAFVTLTYDDEHLPLDRSVDPKHAQDWLKRLRARVAPARFRFFLVGEYGDETERPHYHAALFGFNSCVYGQSRYKFRRDCCYWCDLVRASWAQGNVFLGRLEDDSAGYMAGYVTKKMTRVDDPRLKGRKPEFGRMSLRPGIGYSALWEIADALMKYELSLNDVPVGLRHGSKVLPMGTYLRRKLRGMIGKDEKISQAAYDEMVAEMRPLQLAAMASKDDPSALSQYIKANSQRLLSFDARQKIYRRRREL